MPSRLTTHHQKQPEPASLALVSNCRPFFRNHQTFPPSICLWPRATTSMTAGAIPAQGRSDQSRIATTTESISVVHTKAMPARKTKYTPYMKGTRNREEATSSDQRTAKETKRATHARDTMRSVNITDHSCQGAHRGTRPKANLLLTHTHPVHVVLGEANVGRQQSRNPRLPHHLDDLV